MIEWFRRLGRRVERLADPAPREDECPLCWGKWDGPHKRGCPFGKNEGER